MKRFHPNDTNLYRTKDVLQRTLEELNEFPENKINDIIFDIAACKEGIQLINEYIEKEMKKFKKEDKRQNKYKGGWK